MQGPCSIRVAAKAAALAVLCAALPAAPATATADGADPPRRLKRFYDQRVVWHPCDSEAAPLDLQCSAVAVPLDYARPDRGTIRLALARFRSTADRPRGSLVLNFGGPGGEGVGRLAMAGKDFMPLAEEYDVVTFDPRGVGRSSPVTCGDAAYSGSPGASGASGSLGSLGSPLDDARDDGPSASASPDQVAEGDPRPYLRRLREVAEACAASSGPVLEHMGTVDAARDMDVIRHALGDRRLNYLGFSYGTRLGAVYAAQFPRRVGRFVLDGVDTLTEPPVEQARAGAAGQQAALERFLTWCVRDIACPFGRDPRVAPRQVVRLVDTLDAHPVPTAGGLRFSGQELVAALGQALYSRALWPPLERAVSDLVEYGDPRGLQGFTQGAFAPPVFGPDAALRPEQPVPPDNPPAALLAVNCADAPERPSAQRIAAGLHAMRASYEKASPVFGRYRLAEALMCYGRPAGTDFVREKVRDLKTPRMLLVGTRGDPATPYRWTVETARRLGSSAVVLDNRGEGHTGYGSSRCVQRAVEDFLVHGELKGGSCPAEDPERGD
ncbi:alpha/beta hydrolase [Streptomyces fragilis]|uniref:Alpha/beta hydrolase n=1 Tax=Streptomyces fragilis TaxID=67301 RepID=A0ABV2YQ97_9ACTN|nr:alpha/beta hydrolase [Streptomyces fragilis]